MKKRGAPYKYGSKPKKGGKGGYHGLHNVVLGKPSILISSDTGQEQRAAAEIRNLLQVILSDIPSSSNGGSVSSRLQEELKSMSKGPTVTSYWGEKRGVVIVQIISSDESIDVVSLVAKIWVLLEQAPQTRFIHKIIPLSKTGICTLEGLEKMYKSYLESSLVDMKPDLKFAIHCKIRGNQFKRMDLVTSCADLVASLQPTWSVDLTSPQVSIVFECIDRFSGVCVFPDGDFLTRNEYRVARSVESKEL